MNIIAKIYLATGFLFDPIQSVFEGNLWKVFNKRFDKFSNGYVVDLACGTGQLARHIKPKGYLGLDINHSYVEFAQKSFRDERVEFLLADITNYQIPEMYEVAFLLSAAHHLTDIQLETLCRNLKKSNIRYFILVDTYPVGIFSNVLAWLDSFLGGGKYLRSIEKLEKIISRYFSISEKGILPVEHTTYIYNYLIGKNK